MTVELTDEQLQEIKRIELNTLIAIKKICDKHNIRYFLAGGTLIGAVRHKGFIPWDDDIDIGMLRSDYDRFLSFSNELPQYISLINYDTYPAFGEPFTKAIDNRTVFVQKFSRNVDVPQGVFIDIFPLDNVPDQKISRRIHQTKAYILRKLILVKNGYSFPKDGAKKIAYASLKLIAKGLTREKLQRAFLRNAIKYNTEQTNEIVNLGGNYGYEKESFPRSYVSKTVTLPFENYKFSVPEAYDLYLKHIYGNYMELPPEEKRVAIHTLSAFSVNGVPKTTNE